MKGILLIGFLLLFTISACAPQATAIPESTNTPAPEPTQTPGILFFGTPMPPSAPVMPSPTYAPDFEQTMSMEYSSVAAALADLTTHGDYAVVVREGWTMILETDGYTSWTFTPPDHAANPTVAKRTIYQDQDGWHIAMRVQCEAEQTACDEFIRQFNVINKELISHLEPQR